MTTPPTKQTFDEKGNSTRDVVFDGPTHTFQGRTSPTLRELMEEFDARFAYNDVWLAELQTELSLGDPNLSGIKSFLTKTYAAGVRAGLMEAMEEAPSRRGDGSIGDELHYEMWNAYRSECLSRLEERLNDGVQE